MSSRASETTPLQLRRPVVCVDGPAGRLTDFILEPRERQLTHLVVEEPSGDARLVPAERLRTSETDSSTIALSCTKADVHACESIRDFSVLGTDDPRPEDDASDIGIAEAVDVPGFAAAGLGGADDFSEGYGVRYHRIPVASAELGPESPVVADGGEVMGSVDGLLVEDGNVTHVVLRRAHHWRAHQLVIPIEAVATVETDRIVLHIPSSAVESFERLR